MMQGPDNFSLPFVFECFVTVFTSQRFVGGVPFHVLDQDASLEARVSATIVTTLPHLLKSRATCQIGLSYILLHDFLLLFEVRSMI